MESQNVTLLLQQARAGNSEAVGALFNAVYGSLRSIARKIMRHEREGHMLQATALGNEAYIRLFGNTPIAAEIVPISRPLPRHVPILIDQARNARALKRNGGARVTLHSCRFWIWISMSTGSGGRSAASGTTRGNENHLPVGSCRKNNGGDRRIVAGSQRDSGAPGAFGRAFLRWELRRGRIDARAVAKN